MSKRKHPVFYGILLMILGFLIEYVLGEIDLRQVSPLIDGFLYLIGIVIAAIGGVMIFLHYVQKPNQ